ncbi:MAG: helix-turn-helix domain-containing protein [Firmicutes bacterium]|nr:helix-turn-helix domain-containing protein [Bacillota bacterium]
MTFKERFRELRIERGLVQQKVADDLKESRSTISHWEAGRGEPCTEKLKIVADYFGVTIDYLVGKTNSLPLSEPK